MEEIFEIFRGWTWKDWVKVILFDVFMLFEFWLIVSILIIMA